MKLPNKIPEKFRGLKVSSEAIEAAKSTLKQAGGDYGLALILASEQWVIWEQKARKCETQHGDDGIYS